MSRKISIAPATAIIQALRQQDISWSTALGELIDNSLDWGAGRVEVDVGGRRLTVRDDGEGCASVEKMLKLGQHMPGKRTKLGRYGVGLKDASFAIGGALIIISSHGGVERTVGVDWDAIERSGEWLIDEPTERPDPRGRGTVITLNNFTKQLNAPTWESIIRDVSYIFSPALRDGRQILFSRGGQRHVAEPMQPPDFEDFVEGTADVGGKGIRYRIGIIKAGQLNPKPGITYTHKHRVIIPYTSRGCGDCPTSRIAGWVRLEDGWKLTKNKDNISDGQEELAAAVYEKGRRLFERLIAESQTVKSEEFSGAINAAFQAFLKPFDESKEKRKRGDEEGAKEPKGTERRRRKATNIQRGTKMLRSPIRVGGLRIEFCPMPEDGSAYGRVDGSGNRVYLYENHPFMERCRRDGNHLCAAVLAVALITNFDIGSVANGNTPILPGLRDMDLADKFPGGMGRLLASADLSDFRIVAPAAQGQPPRIAA